MRRAFTIFLVLFACIAAPAVGQSSVQDSCNLIIVDAEEEFRNGRYTDVTTMLEKALVQCSYSRKDKETIYILLTRAYIELDQIDMVNKRLRSMLKNNPNFVLKEELVEQDFARYYSKFKVWPMVNVSLRGAYAQPNFNVLKEYSILDGVDYSAPYKSILEPVMGGYVEFFPIKNWSLTSELNYTNYNIERSVGTNKSWSLDYKEELDLWELNLYAKKYFSFNGWKYNPYVFGGIYFTRLAEASGDIALTYDAIDKLTNTADNNDIASTSINREEERAENNSGYLFGVGVNRKIQNFMISLEGRYASGSNNIMSVKNKYRNPELIFNYYYVDNDLTVDKFEVGVSIGYIIQYGIHKRK